MSDSSSNSPRTGGRPAADTAVSDLFAVSKERFDLKRWLRLAWRRKWLLIIPIVVAVAGAAGVMTQLAPEYGATALVILEGGTAKPEPAVPGSPPVESTSGRIISEADLLQSANLLGQVADKMGLAQDPEFGAAAESWLGRVWNWGRQTLHDLVGWPETPVGIAIPPRAKALATLTDAVSVVTRAPSTLIVVTVKSVDRAKAERIANAITSTYVVEKAQAKAEALRRVSEFFESRITGLKNDSEAADLALAEFRAKAGISAPDGRTTAAQALTELNSQLSLARTQTAEKESRLKALQRARATPSARAGVAEILNNPVISSMQLQEAEVARRVADLTQRYGDRYPRVGETKAELAQIQGRIAAEIERIAVSMEGDLDAARAKEAQIKEQVDRLEQTTTSQGQTTDEYRRLQLQADSARNAYRDLLRRSNEQQERISLGTPEARILAAAASSDVPVFPRYWRTIYMSALFGLLAGVVWIYVAERLDAGFRSAEQVEEITGRPVIGMIPLVGHAIGRKATPVKVVTSKPMSVYSEALRATSTAIALRTKDPKPKVLMVTSSVPGEGKSTFACSLASLMARSNPQKKIVLVDCDFRRASVGELLGASTVGGTIDQYLMGKSRLDQLFGREKSSGLYYVLSRTDTANSAELLASSGMRTFVEALAGQFDQVVLDTPPLMAVSDPRIVAQLSDYVIFLVRWGETEQGLALNALKLLEDSKAEVGVVLSQVDLKRHKQYGYHDYGGYYSKYHDYYKG